MEDRIFRNILRFVFLLIIQVLIFKRLDLSIGEFHYIHLIVYPLAVLLLPLDTPKALVLTIAFAYGFIFDCFYNSPGVHAGALVFTAYLKNLVLRILEPFEGYPINISPTMSVMGFTWFISYASILMFLHCFTYFSFDSFSFVFIYSITLNAVFSFIPSMVIILLFQFIFRNKH